MRITPRPRVSLHGSIWTGTTLSPRQILTNKQALSTSISESLGALVIGVLVLSGIGVGIGASYNYAQESNAKSSLEAVKASEVLYQAKEGAFGNAAQLSGGEDPALSSTPDSLAIVTSGTSYCALVTSSSMFPTDYWLTSTNSQVFTSPSEAAAAAALAEGECPAAKTVTNRLLTPTPAAGVGGWSANNALYWTGSRDTSTVRRPGSVSARHVRTSLGTTEAIGSWYSVGAAAWASVASPPVTPGEVISLSVYWYTASPSASARIGYVFLNAAGERVLGDGTVAPGSTIRGPKMDGPSSQWNRVTAENIRVPEGVVEVRVAADVMTAAGAGAGDTAYIQDAQMESGSVATPFVSGDLADEGGSRYNWTGVADRSASTLDKVLVNG